MNYDTEAWYKLYIRESTEDKLLPVLNRALRDFLLRLAKSRTDATILGKTSAPGPDLARALGAVGAEAETIAEFVLSMLADGYLSHRRGRLWITNFVEAQEARSPGARRQKTYRDKGRKSRTGGEPENNGGVSGAADSDITGDATVASHATSQKIRSEERRDETSREEPRRARDAPAVAAVDSSDPEPDPGRETLCPLDLAARAEIAGVPAQLAERLGIPVESIRHEIGQFVATWTIGKLAGQKRTAWMGRLRQWVIDQHGRGALKPAGAVEHDARRGARRANESDATVAPSPMLALMPGGAK